jgi:hypothetical protein
MLPTIDMPEPMQEAIPAFGVGPGLAALCLTTERCLIHWLIRTAPAVMEIPISVNPPIRRARRTASDIFSSEGEYDE